MRGSVTGFRVTWWRKDVGELKDAFAELKRPKVGRLPRLRGTAEMPASEPVQIELESYLAERA